MNRKRVAALAAALVAALLIHPRPSAYPHVTPHFQQCPRQRPCRSSWPASPTSATATERVPYCRLAVVVFTPDSRSGNLGEWQPRYFSCGRGEC